MAFNASFRSDLLIAKFLGQIIARLLKIMNWPECSIFAYTFQKAKAAFLISVNMAEKVGENRDFLNMK